MEDLRISDEEQCEEVPLDVLITESLEELENEIDRYVKDARRLFAVIVQFMNSSDCNTLKLFDNDHDKFIHFMMNQRTYRKMLDARLRLIEKKTQLEL